VLDLMGVFYWSFDDLKNGRREKIIKLPSVTLHLMQNDKDSICRLYVQWESIENEYSIDTEIPVYYIFSSKGNIW
jgi:hypothetical protein